MKFRKCERKTGAKNKIAGFSLPGLFIFLPTLSFAQISHDEILVTAVGDIMLGRYVDKVCQNRITIDEVSKILGSGNAAFGNLESCFGGGSSPMQEKAANLKAPDEAVSALKNMGFTVASLANNHCMDFGSDAVSHTKNLLESQGIRSVGGFSNQGRAIPAVLKVKSVRIGFMGYSAHIPKNVCAAPGYSGIAPLSCESVLDDISALRARVDVLVVSVHWGREYSNKPAPDQILTAHRLVDAGADIVWGHHPHVLQGIENYKGRLIAYSLGNFIFDQVRRDTTRTIMMQCSLRNRRILRVKIIPVIVDRYLPRLANADEASAIVKYVRGLSDQLASLPDVFSWRIQ
jgi:poly-gamma-glutamate capsule biosynthesis protein CapA/YwtB (metallophosphatase superfamily)